MSPLPLLAIEKLDKWLSKMLLKGVVSFSSQFSFSFLLYLYLASGTKMAWKMVWKAKKGTQYEPYD